MDEFAHVLLRTINALSRVIEIRDLYTVGHQQNVSRIARRIGQEIGLDHDTIEGLRVGSTLHDIGKVGIPAEILAKPAKLTPTEYELVKAHSTMGYSVLREISFPWPVAEIVHQHHERIDGSGYPGGMKGDDILIQAQILGVADTVDSMLTHRPYRAAQGPERAMRVIAEGAGTKFAQVIADACCKLMERDELMVEFNRPRS